VRDKNRVLAAWSDIDVQLKRRYDLIPKLVDAVKQWSEQFADVFTEIRNKEGNDYHPSWYHHGHGRLDVSRMTSSLGSSLGSAISSSSHARGSSSGSGGGGSSGGGGGGGGGGGW
jgi:uncharacterized membrane protein YgcG